MLCLTGGEEISQVEKTIHRLKEQRLANTLNRKHTLKALHFWGLEGSLVQKVFI